MEDDQRKLMARALLGQGMAGQTADLQKLMPIYQQQSMQAQVNGQPMPQFQEWAQQFLNQSQ